MVRPLRARRSTDNRWDPDDVPWLLAGLALIGGLLLVFGVMLDYSALDVWTGIIVFLVLTGASVPLLRWVARKDGDPWLYRTLTIALLVKFAASMARYFMIFVMYDGSADAGRYHSAGVMFANRLRDGVPIHPLDAMAGFPIETQRVADVVGGIYTVTGPSAYAGFIIFAYLCFWGQVLMVRAFRVAVPEGDHRRYTLLAMFLPSLLFWPSSIGKEAAIIFLLGVIVYGGGLLLAPRPQLRGAVFFAGGSLLVLLVRPHVATMSIGALVLAMVVGVLAGFRSEGGRAVAGTRRGRAVRLAALVLLVVLAVGASTRLGEVFGEEGEDATALSALEGTASQSSRGGSEFAPVGVSGPSEVPSGIVSVYFRPFPWEAANMNSLIAAGESLLLFGLFVANWRRVAALPKLALRRPYLVFCSAYIVVFAIGFSYIANFGILARQRVQALPILLVLLALPPIERYSFSRRRSAASPKLLHDSSGTAGRLDSDMAQLRAGRQGVEGR